MHTVLAVLHFLCKFLFTFFSDFSHMNRTSKPGLPSSSVTHLVLYRLVFLVKPEEGVGVELGRGGRTKGVRRNFCFIQRTIILFCYFVDKYCIG